ncbi:hypothetical protein [Methylobacterium nigriterrae]|uniref:hypothetical protein n=1 Tax=Methylobacterium nigriterrae TaxID=3127512 RepID=UPI003013BD42
MQEAGTYNIFQRTRQPSLRCAVLQSRPVPAFIQGETWEFAGTTADEAGMPLGFQSEAADEATRLAGYYLFQSLPAGVIALREGWPPPLARSLTCSDGIGV